MYFEGEIAFCLHLWKLLKAKIDTKAEVKLRESFQSDFFIFFRILVRNIFYLIKAHHAQDKL